MGPLRKVATVHEFRLPDIGEGLTDAEIVRWHVRVGDLVDVDQLLVEVETAKAVVEITSPYAGTVLHLGGVEGDTIAVGEILIVVGEPGERWKPDRPVEAADVPASVETSAPSPPVTAAGRVKAMPIVRKLAREHGVDLATIAGSGPGGAITRADVERAITSTAPGDGDQRVTMSRLRRTIAENMTRSWREIPHVTVHADVDATALLTAHRALREATTGPVPLEALIATAVLPALRRFPEFNATVDGDEVILHRRYDLGFAVDTPDGLMVVVVRDADAAVPTELARRITDLAEAARSRTATPDQLTGQTFTVSNIGALGGGAGTPIIPWGTTAILSIGRATDTPVARDGGIFVAPVAPLNLSYDHRLIDGALGQRFLSMVVEHLETMTPPV